MLRRRTVIFIDAADTCSAWPATSKCKAAAPSLLQSKSTLLLAAATTILPLPLPVPPTRQASQLLHRLQPPPGHAPPPLPRPCKIAVRRFRARLPSLDNFRRCSVAPQRPVPLGGTQPRLLIHQQQPGPRSEIPRNYPHSRRKLSLQLAQQEPVRITQQQQQQPQPPAAKRNRHPLQATLRRRMKNLWLSSSRKTAPISPPILSLKLTNS